MVNRDQILNNPASYLGSVELVNSQQWVFNQETNKMQNKTIFYSPGKFTLILYINKYPIFKALYKIFDELLINATTNYHLDPQKMTTIRVNIDPNENLI